MFFVIKYNKYNSSEFVRLKALTLAFCRIKNFKLHANEQLLDNFLKQQYNRSLKDLCIELLTKLVLFKNGQEELILLFRDPYYDKIARIITYGTGNIPGSPILKASFK